MRCGAGGERKSSSKRGDGRGGVEGLLTYDQWAPRQREEGDGVVRTCEKRLVGSEMKSRKGRGRARHTRQNYHAC